MKTINKIKETVGSQIQSYHPIKRWRICDTTVLFQTVPHGTNEHVWRETLETWLPRYDSVGWLNMLAKICILPEIANNENGKVVGRYNGDGSIELKNDIDLGSFSGFVHNNNREAVLTHEVIHHAHLGINGYKNSERSSNKETMLKQDVSFYAGSDVGEAIAEIGTGIVHGENFPSWVHDYYRAKDGPMEAYDIG